MALQNKKSLGQHWLKNREILDEIAAITSGKISGSAQESSNNLPDNPPRDPLKPSESRLCLEIGPGLGFLTSSLLKVFPRVLAVEFDQKLAANLPKSFPGKNLTVINDDFLNFDLENGLKNISMVEKTAQNATKTAQNTPYVVAGNIPYYITSPIITKLLEANNRPERIVLLVQKEVAERIAAGAEPNSALGTTSTYIPTSVSGAKRSFFSIYAQNLATVALGPIVGRELFTPPPKVDSQVIVLVPRPKPLISDAALTLARRGFSAPRKKLVKNLSSYFPVEKLKSALIALDLSTDARPADLSPSNWQALSNKLNSALAKNNHNHYN